MGIIIAMMMPSTASGTPNSEAAPKRFRILVTAPPGGELGLCLCLPPLAVGRGVDGAAIAAAGTGLIWGEAAKAPSMEHAQDQEGGNQDRNCPYCRCARPGSGYNIGMTPTLEKILAEVRALSAVERTELRDILANEPVSFPPRDMKLVDELWGKYKDTPGSVEEFLKRKHEDNERDEQRFERR